MLFLFSNPSKARRITEITPNFHLHLLCKCEALSLKPRPPPQHTHKRLSYCHGEYNLCTHWFESEEVALLHLSLFLWHNHPLALLGGKD
jgi:hypothetical protein